jgi:hypothetical protein
MTMTIYAVIFWDGESKSAISPLSLDASDQLLSLPCNVGLCGLSFLFCNGWRHEKEFAIYKGNILSISSTFQRTDTHERCPPGRTVQDHGYHC